MNISTADFDWISLLLVAGAGIIGLIKSSSAKKRQIPPILQQPDFTEEEEEDILSREDYTIQMPQEQYTVQEEIQPEPILTSDYYRDPQTPVFNPDASTQEEETEYEEKDAFNIRQAIISSEILKRPQY